MSDWKRVENPAPDGRKPRASAVSSEPTPLNSPDVPPASPLNKPGPEAASLPEQNPPADVHLSSRRRSPGPFTGTETPAPTPPAEADDKPGERAEGPGAVPAPEGESLAALAMPEGDDTKAPIRSPRYTKHGRRKGRLWYAAPLGFLVLVLAAVGVVSLILTGINAIQKSRDDTALRAELGDFLLPVMQYCPTPFTNINDEQQDALLLAAIWRVTTAEQVRQYRENDETSLYPEDEEYRLLIPIEEIEASYRHLFGSEALPNHHSIEEDSQGFAFEYDPENACYHVPFTTVSSNYVPVLDTLKQKGDTVTVRVAYVSNQDIAIDDNGNEIPPTADQATYAQLYTVVKTADGWALTSIAKEE